MVQFIETPRFPENISYGSSGGPGFKTDIFEGHSGVEQRTQRWARARARYDVSYGIRDTEQMDDVRNFFYAMRGRAIGFRYKDWADYTLDDHALSTVGNGVLAAFQIDKTYGASTANPYVRKILKIVPSTTSVTVNNVAVPVGPGATQVAVNENTGLLTFGASVIPANTHIVRVTCEFDVPVRFDVDDMNATYEAWNAENWSSIPLVEVREEDLS